MKSNLDSLVSHSNTTGPSGKSQRTNKYTSSKHSDNLSSLNPGDFEELNFKGDPELVEITTTELKDDDIETRIWTQFVRSTNRTRSH